jgi:hypothetical protein
MAPKCRFWDTLLALYEISTPKADSNAKSIPRQKLAVKILRVRLQRIERKWIPKAQIGNEVLTKSAACAQMLTGAS